MVLSDFWTGTILAVLAATAFGTQASFSKVSSVISCKIRMEMFNIYFMIGVAITCLIAHFILTFLFDYSIKFSYMGIICALLLYFGELFTLLSVQQIGVAYGTAFGLLSASVTSVIIQHILGQRIQNYPITIIGLFIVTITVISSVFLNKIISSIPLLKGKDLEPTQDQQQKESIQNNTKYIEMQNIQTIEATMQATDIDINEQMFNNDQIENNRNVSTMIMGFVYSSVGGVCYCSLPLPTLYVDEFSKGIKMCLSFGIGCLVVFPLSFVNVGLMNTFYKSEEMNIKEVCLRLITLDERLWHIKKAGLAGLAAGCVWGIGNLMGICTFLYLDYMVVMVYMQFNIIVALLWGICLWKEISQTIEIVALSVLSLTLVGGCVLVTFGVYGEP